MFCVQLSLHRDITFLTHLTFHCLSFYGSGCREGGEKSSFIIKRRSVASVVVKAECSIDLSLKQATLMRIQLIMTTTAAGWLESQK